MRIPPAPLLQPQNRPKRYKTRFYSVFFMNYTSKEVKNAQRSGDLFGDLERFLTLGLWKRWNLLYFNVLFKTNSLKTVV